MSRKTLTNEEYIKRYGYEEGMRKIKRREYDKQRYASNRDSILEYQKAYNATHKEELAAYKKEYYATHKEEIASYNKAYNATHKEELAAYNKEYNAAHKEEKAAYRAANRDSILEYHKDYYATQSGRANSLLNRYKRSDKQYNRGECTLTADWILSHIFNSKCVYCGESDWTKLGCDRIDNSKPHTPLNVVCCCGKCNREKGLKNIEIFKQIKKNEVA